MGISLLYIHTSPYPNLSLSVHIYSHPSSLGESLVAWQLVVDPETPHAVEAMGGN